MALLASLWFGLPVVSLALDEGAVPPSSDAPSLPVGVRVVDEEVLCGSGGCYRELRLRGPEGQPPDELAASVGLQEEACAPRSLLDRRRVCSGVHVVGDDVVLYVQFDR